MRIDDPATLAIVCRPGWAVHSLPLYGAACPVVCRDVAFGTAMIGLDDDGTIIVQVSDCDTPALATAAELRDIAAQLVAVADALEAKGG